MRFEPNWKKILQNSGKWIWIQGHTRPYKAIQYHNVQQKPLWNFFFPLHIFCSIWNIFCSWFHANPNKNNNNTNKASLKTFEQSSRSTKMPIVFNVIKFFHQNYHLFLIFTTTDRAIVLRSIWSNGDRRSGSDGGQYWHYHRSTFQLQLQITASVRELPLWATCTSYSTLFTKKGFH